jgi:hypothetical protein
MCFLPIALYTCLLSFHFYLLSDFRLENTSFKKFWKSSFIALDSDDILKMMLKESKKLERLLKCNVFIVINLCLEFLFLVGIHYAWANVHVFKGYWCILFWDAKMLLFIKCWGHVCAIKRLLEPKNLKSCNFALNHPTSKHFFFLWII